MPENEKPKEEYMGNKKKDLNRIRSTQRFIDPEKGPENKA